MPIYEYQCSACGRVVEMMQKLSDPPLANCPDCNAPVSKLMSRTSFQLKGTGWYATDYKKSTATKSDKPETKTEASTPDATSAKSTVDSPAKKDPA